MDLVGATAGSKPDIIIVAAPLRHARACPGRPRLQGTRLIAGGVYGTLYQRRRQQRRGGHLYIPRHGVVNTAKRCKQRCVKVILAPSPSCPGLSRAPTSSGNMHGRRPGLPNALSPRCQQHPPSMETCIRQSGESNETFKVTCPTLRHARAWPGHPRLQAAGMAGGWVYIMTNHLNGTLYVGVTSNISRRAWEHRQGQPQAASPPATASTAWSTPNPTPTSAPQFNAKRRSNIGQGPGNTLDHRNQSGLAGSVQTPVKTWMAGLRRPCRRRRAAGHTEKPPAVTRLASRQPHRPSPHAFSALSN